MYRPIHVVGGFKFERYCEAFLLAAVRMQCLIIFSSYRTSYGRTKVYGRCTNSPTAPYAYVVLRANER